MYEMYIGMGAVLVGYWLYTPLPPGIAEPWKLRILLVACKISALIVSVISTLKLASRLNGVRLLMSWVFRAAAKPVDDSHVEISNENFDGIGVRLYRPRGQAQVLPGLVYCHGGGFIVFGVDTYDHVMRRLSLEANIVVVSVEYRLSPEYTFPIPLEDCVKVTTYILKNGHNFGVDVSNVGIAGDSAGGNLAAAACRTLSYDKPRDLPPLKYQGLIYPELQSFDFRTPSFIENANVTPDLLSVPMVISAWTQYWHGKCTDEDLITFQENAHVTHSLRDSVYGEYVDCSLLDEPFRRNTLRDKKYKENKEFSDEFENNLLNPFFCPLLANDLSLLPPTYILTAEFDVLRDDGLLYAKRLKDADVPVCHVHAFKGFHGIFSFTRFNIGLQCVQSFSSFIKKMKYTKSPVCESTKL